MITTITVDVVVIVVIIVAVVVVVVVVVVLFCSGDLSASGPVLGKVVCTTTKKTTAES